MSDRRPPTKPGRPGARAAARSVSQGQKVRELDERTDAVLQAPPRAARSARDGFEQTADTSDGVHELLSADISSIEGEELGPAPSDPGFEVPPHAGVFVPPPAGLASASFGDALSTAGDADGAAGPSTDPMRSAERPIEVLRWSMRGGEPPTATPSPASPTAPQRVRTSVVPLPLTDHGEAPSGTTRAGATRDTPPAIDVVELRRILADADRLLATASAELGSRDSYGAKVQLGAARHRLAEAVALLKRS